MFEDILERDVPEQLVLTEQRHIHVDELSAWLETAIGRLVRSADAFGGVTAPVFVAYHGEVNLDSDGPVEVCVPIDAARRADVTAADAWPNGSTTRLCRRPYG